MEDTLSFEMQNKTIHKVFSERSDFIIIGLTGAIGGDLKSVTEIMEKDFSEFCLPEYTFAKDLTDQLEYSKIYHYAKKHWKKFDLIRARDIIIT